MNWADVEPAGTVTLVGALAVALEVVKPRETAKPPVGAAADSVTVHTEEAGATTDVGEHERPVSELAGWEMVTIPATPPIVKPSPAAEDAAGARTLTVLEVEVVDEEIVNATFATTPSLMMFWFIPHRTQTYCPDPVELQLTDLLAADADAPALTVTPDRSVGEKDSVHCSPAACAPAEV